MSTVRVYHGTSRLGARSIRERGVGLEHSCGGNYGHAFYVAEEMYLAAALAQGGDYDLEGDKGVEIVEMDLELNHPLYLALDTAVPEHWTRWKNAMDGLDVGDKALAFRLCNRGVGAVKDVGGMGGWAIYAPVLLTLVGRAAS